MEMYKQNVESNNATNLVDPSISTNMLSDTAVGEMCNFDRGLFGDYIDAGISVADILKNVSEPEQHDPGCGNSGVDNFINETTSKNFEKNEELHNDTCSKCKRKSSNDQSTQVESSDSIVSFCTFIKTEQDLVTMCNIKSFAVLDELAKAMDKYYSQKQKCVCTTRECIILTTAKLKLDIPFAALGVFFNVCVVTICNVFYATVKKLATILQSMLARVTKEEITNNMPKCFVNYQSTTSVFDCTEIQLQQPKCLKCCLKFYSCYVGGPTVKFMTEVTPGGLIVGVSKAFGGRASNKSIFNQTNALPQLESTRDAIMVDKSFLIDDECDERRIKLIKPSFLRSQKLEQESIENKDIVCARVLIDRMSQRIKQFEILNHKLNWFLANYIGDIFIICCGLTNLGTPIVADDEFL